MTTPERTERVLVSALREHVGETVELCGWVQTLRRQRAMQFVLLRDHSGVVQVTHKRGGPGEVEAAIDAVTPESAVRIIGRVVDNPVVKLGDRVGSGWIIGTGLQPGDRVVVEGASAADGSLVNPKPWQPPAPSQ